MAEAVPSKDEIMALANDVLKYAVERRLVEQNYTVKSAPGYQQMSDWIRSQYAWIVDAFAQACSYAPDDVKAFEPLIDGPRKAEAALTEGVELNLAGVDSHGKVVAAGAKAADPFWSSVNGVQAKVGEWTGDAADNFRQNFLTHLSVVPANQSIVCRSLYLSMEATKEVYGLYLIGLKELGTKARAILHPSLCHGVDIHLTIKVAAGVTKILAGIATLEDGGVFVAIEGGMTLVEAYSEGHEGGEKEMTIYGTSAPDVLQSVDEILKEMERSLDDREQELVTLLNQNVDRLGGSNRAFYVVPHPSVVDVANRPGLATDPNTTLWNEFD